MAFRKQMVPLALVSVLVLAVGVACSSGAAPSPTAAPAKSAATSAPAAPAATSAPAAAATSAPAAAPTKAAAASGGDIIMGITLNVTGPTASQGELFGNSAKLAVKQINAAGGINGKQIKLVTEDMQSTNPGALAATNKLIEQDNALVMIGSALSTQIQAVSDTVKAAGIPEATGGTAVKNTNMGNPWIFRLRPDDSVAAAAMMGYAVQDLKATKVGILHDSDAFGSGGATLLEQYAKDQGVTVVKDLPYTADSKDFTAQLLAIKDAGAQVIFTYCTRPEDAATIERQYHDLKLPYKYVGSPSNAESDTLALSKSAAAGDYAVIDFYPGQTPESKAYGEAYQKEYGKPMDGLSSWNYDAVELYAKAIGAVGTNRQKIMQYILGIHGNYTGVCGTYNFTPNGDGLHSNTVVQIQPDDSLKFIKVVSAPVKKQ